MSSASRWRLPDYEYELTLQDGSLVVHGRVIDPQVRKLSSVAPGLPARSSRRACRCATRSRGSGIANRDQRPSRSSSQGRDLGLQPCWRAPSSAAGATCHRGTVTSEELAADLGGSGAAITERSGIVRRHRAEPGLGPSDLARVAAEAALATAAGLEPADVD